MSRIESVFSQLGREDKQAIIPFLTAGDPSAETTLGLLKMLAEEGADVIELGMPYSDPMADGPVIQEASERALAAGMDVRGVLEIVRQFRKEWDTPIILFGYFNPILQYGELEFARDAKEAGADGCLVVDLPPEEAECFVNALRKEKLDFIALLTPTSGPERMESARRIASGFLYYVSLKGVTGAARKGAYGELGPRIDTLRQAVGLPVAVGFGISSRADVAEVIAVADGAVIGSSFIRAVQNGGPTREGMIQAGRAYFQDLVSAR